ncbi:MAG TPA: pitrilysin family protein [Nitrospiria bacterium]|nr:pitrilysin family protein [Nitrospiria bacterium]
MARPYRYGRLANGLRVLAEPMSESQSVAIGVWCQVGSRHELSEEAGLAHFLEHLCFKGTAHRSARDISEEIDRLGGELNAFTTREHTAFYASVLGEHLPHAVDLLADLVLHPGLTARDVEKERQVVIEEIRMVDDNPEEMVHDLHARQLWGRHPLGRPVQGTAHSVGRLSRRQVVGFWRNHYRPSNMIVAAAGRLQWRPLLRQLDRTFGRWRPRFSAGRSGGAPPAPPARQGVRFIRRSLTQLHCCLSAPGLPQHHPDRFAGYLLNTILGGSVSSRLFQEVRERRGLAYTVYSSQHSFADTGTTSVYAACQPSAGAKVVKLIERELHALARTGVGRRELGQAKEQLRGTVLLGLEHPHARMSRLARELLYLDRVTPIEEGLRAVEAVTPSQVRRLAASLFVPSTYSVTLLGPSAPGVSHRS